jgi:ABC-type transport system involved in cytochrome bd biosynthesis fused ATPase/permease subunit
LKCIALLDLAMAVRIIVLFAIFLLTAPLRCFGQETEAFPDSALTREQWQQRIQDARRRSEEFVASARERSETSITPAQAETEATSRALNDPSLQQGDVISTGKGFVVFVGRDEEHRPGDFVSASPRHQPP